LVQWVHQNIASHGGDPERVFIWSQSAGKVRVSTYIAHQEFHAPQGIGLKGAVLMSAPAFNILPATPPQTAAIPPCGQPNGAAAPPNAAAAAPPAAPAPAGEAQPDAATLLKRS